MVTSAGYATLAIRISLDSIKNSVDEFKNQTADLAKSMENPCPNCPRHDIMKNELKYLHEILEGNVDEMSKKVII